MGWVARSLALHQGFSSPFLPDTGPTALMPPLFPYLLSLIFRLTGIYTLASAFLILLVQSLCSVFTCVPVFLIARRLYTVRAGMWAVWVWAFYPYAVYYSAGEVWDYSVTALLFSCFLALLLQLHHDSPAKLWRNAGLLIGVAALSNPSILPAALFLATITVRFHRNLLQTHLLKLGILLGAVLVVLLPWSIRNAMVMRVAVPVRDGFWLEMWAGNHGDTFATNPPSAHPATNPAEMALFMQQGETRYLATKRHLALDWARQHSAQFLTLTIRRIIRFWAGYWSVDASYLKQESFELANVFFCGTVTLLMAFGLRRLFIRHHRNAARVVSVLLIFPLPYYLTHASMDYRQPVEPLIVVLVTLGVLPLRGLYCSPKVGSVEAQIETR